MATTRQRPKSYGHVNIHVFNLLLVLILNLITTSYSAASSSDVAALLKFKESLKDDSGALSSWSASTAPCFGGKNNWSGIICSRGGNIWGLRLENMKLSGSIDVDSLAGLSRLRSVSFTGNDFGGPVPDFRRLKPLKSLFLGHNNFEGALDPNAFEGMRRLKKVDLSYNKFSGEIPASLTALQRLVELRLDGNQFQGPIPNFAINTLQKFNVSNNQLQGPIPQGLVKFDPSAFSGNSLCGGPLATCSPTPTPPLNQNKTPPHPIAPSSDKPIPIIAVVAGVVVAMVLAILIILMVLRNRCEKGIPEGRSTNGPPNQARKPGGLATTRKNNNNNNPSTSPDNNNEGSNRSTTSTGSRHTKGENGKLSFVREDTPRFDLPDLLKAAAEILGSGCFGSSYKATLNNGSAVVVKRFKQMNNVGREEFQEHMRRLGRLLHPNLLSLVAYYYRKEEKLFITNPIEKGSLAVLLHGQTRGKQTLDWPTRLKVIKGVARGLSELYKELPSLVAPHGHLKSSNVLLNASFEPVLSDYGLIPLINQESAQELMVAYKSPEYFNNGRVTKKTDVWALGILIIETMTGKFPASYLQQGNEVDMSTWVQSVIDGGFDKNMGPTIRNSDGEMQKLLNIGMACCETDVEKRLDIKEALEKIEEVKERDHEDDFYSSYESTEPDMRSSRGMSDDFTVIIN